MTSVQIRIFAAVLFGVIMVGGAFVMSLGKEERAMTDATNESPLIVRKHIPIADSNEDGVPDWQANLIDGEPIYLDATNTEPYVTPDTLTGQFSVRFFQDVTTLNQFGLLEDTEDELIEAAIKELIEKTQERIYTEADLKNIIQTNDPGALRAYGNLVAGNIFYYQTDEENEFAVFSRMLQNNNPKHLEKLEVIEKQYDDIINGLLQLEVPQKYSFEHLAIINSFSSLKENVVGMQKYFDDPFYTMMRYRRLGEDVLGMNLAIAQLYDALYLDENIQFAENEALPVLVELLQ